MGRIVLIVVLCATTAFNQQASGTLKGQILDEFGGAIVGATVVVVSADGTEKSAKTNGEGSYFVALAPGKYTIHASAEGFAVSESSGVELIAGRSQQLNITLKVTIEQQKVTTSTQSGGLSTDPENNLGAIVFKGSDLEALPEDPDDLAAALQVLAGSAAGPSGGQIFIDGFTGGSLPPLSSIREIRINSNPFSAEYDRPGFGRIEIFTKPGTERFHGQASFSFNNQALNSRNPFAPTRPPYMSRQYGGNLSGPIFRKKASFFVDFEKRDINDAFVVNATILDPNLNVMSFSQTVPKPNRRTEFSPRIDYALNALNTLMGRYEYTHSSDVAGAGGFSLESRAYHTASTEHVVRLTETAVINKKTVNETRFQFIHQISGDDANNSIPTISVRDAFIGGGSQIGLASNEQNRWELTNITSLVLGTHTVRFGGRARNVRITSISPQNFGGTWSFFGSRNGITSIQAYQITEQGLQQGLTPGQIRALGGGASQFAISTGNPEATVGQLDFGAFVHDDWNVRPNLTVSAGLRYENQANIRSNYNFAPRLGFAWAPGPASSPHSSKTVIRGGFGIFYDRISESLTLNANRLNGMNQQQYIGTNPAILNLFPNVPSIAALTGAATPVTIDQLAKDIRPSYSMQSALSVERTLPHNVALSVTYINTHTLHLLRTRAINAPLPGTFISGVPNTGVRPFGTANNIFEHESSGRFNQSQVNFQVRSNLSRTVSFVALYYLAKAHSDTDGTGSFPANSYDLSGEYGRSSLDVRQRFVMGGNFRAPWRMSLAPLVVVGSGAPFNIIIGRDLNGDTVLTERPAFASDLTKPGVVITRFGALDPNPAAGERIIPRNLGKGPGSVIVNLRVSTTFSFAGERSGGGGVFGGGASKAERYKLTFSVNFQNLLNHTNLGRPVGNLSSSLFGISNGSGGNFGGFGGGRGGGGTTPYNRLIEAQVRFSF